MMYIAQHTAAPSANITPTGSSGSPWPRGSSSNSPTSAQPTHTKSTGRREDHIATANGPQNSIATAMPNGIVRSAM